MPTPTLSTKVAMSGEKEYRQALSEINSGLKVLSSEMKLTAEQFANNADSMEALTAKGDVLERQILSQKEKIETLQEALKRSADAYGESDKRTASWQVSLNNAQAALLKMERELDQNREAIEQAAAAAAEAENAYGEMADALDETNDGATKSKSIFDTLQAAFGGANQEAVSLSDMVDDLAGKFGLDLPDGAKKALDALGDMDGKTAALAAGFGAIAAAVVKVESALISMTTERAEIAATLSNIAQTINMDIEATQQWDYVLKTVGSSIEDAQGDLSAFQEKIMEAAGGTGEAAEMFALLGVNVVDQNGALRDTEAVLTDTVRALQLMANETERNAISSTLLGSTGEKLIPIYNKTAQELEYLLEKSKDLGILTGDQVEALKDVSEALLDYEERTASAKDIIAAEFAPALEQFYEMAGKGVLNLGEAAEASGLVNFFGATLDLVSALAPAIEILGDLFVEMSPAIQVFSIAMGVAADALSIVLNLVSALVNLLDLDFKSAMNNFDAIGGILSGNNSATSRAWGNAFNASGDYNFDGGYTWVGENGPELAYFPSGTRIFNSQESRELGGDTFYVTIDAKNVKEFNDIVEMAKAKRRTDRQNGGRQ
ncbi:MAG: hypothetical protein IJX67_12170 [Oscillospiraceae bacterium]|nr:hypothetical protein [Oscillospiraceae bacterium]